MKLIVTGGNGFVAGEVIRQSLLEPKVTSLVVLSRSPIVVPDGLDSAKLKQVIVEDYESYPDSTRKEFANADGCIWTVAITMSKSKGMDLDVVTRICLTSTLECLAALVESGITKPLRFAYIGGFANGLDPTKLGLPQFMVPYMLMRSETAEKVLEFGKEHKGDIEACIAKPGRISSDVHKGKSLAELPGADIVPDVTVQQIAAALLQQTMDGFDSDKLENADLKSIGQKHLRESSNS